MTRCTGIGLYEEKVFIPDQWNHGDGEEDYFFLLDMFLQECTKKGPEMARSRGLS